MCTVLKNARIYTMNEAQPWAEAVVFENEHINYIGKDDPSLWSKYAGKNPTIVDIKERMITPGIIDSHTHPGMVSQSSWHIKLPYTHDVDEILDFIRDYAKNYSKEEVPFLYFEYYPTDLFGSEGPSKNLLDKAVSDRPCLCQDFGDHMHWVNSKMLELMEITKDTPDPVPGLEIFVRDKVGDPTGWVKEGAWIHFSEKLFENISWKPPLVMTPKLMKKFFKFYREHGITAIGDGLLEGEAQLSAMYELDKGGDLKLYYDGVLRFWDFEGLPTKIEELRRYQEKYTTKHIKINAMKLFLDGTNESGNSAVLNPHLNDPIGKNHGEIKMNTEELKKCMVLLNTEKLDLNIHIVGDRGFRVACDAVEMAQNEVNKSGGNWSIQIVFLHCELVHPDDILRPAKLGITINWSPHWSGGYFGEESIPFIGLEKWRSMYQFNPMIDSGALVTFSSDVVSFYELHRAHPFFGMQVGHTRVDPEFPLDEARFPGCQRPESNARLSREDLMKGYTINGAKQLHWEDQMGSLVIGKLANMNILSDNFFEVPAERISSIKFDAVIFEGEVIHGKL